MKPYVGYRPEDYQTPYADFFTEAMAPIPAHAEAGLLQSPFRAGALPPFEAAAAMASPGYAEVENGYSREADGSIRVAIRTDMPGVSPPMWDWWFGWHGCRSNRYKLWHPKAHLEARWKDGGEQIAYVGRTSLIVEYIGRSLEKAAIRFVQPSEAGFDPLQYADPGKVVYICARVGYRDYPIDFGWLIHQVRAVGNGAEMRSRFWFGGPYIQLRAPGLIARLLSRALQKTIRVPEQRAKDLLIHCSEEMNHLAGFLPQLYNKFK